MKPTLCLDFDGVCHSYVQPYVSDVIIPDPPVEGLFDFLEKAAPHFRIAVYGSRSKTEGGRAAMAKWFRSHAFYAGRNPPPLEFPASKPPAFVSIDDRALTFDGIWPDIQMLREFRPWNKK